MNAWTERILRPFHSEVARFWIALDPDGLLLDEALLAALAARGFALVRFADSIAFRADYETRWRAAWDRGEPGPAAALVLHLHQREADALPWDYLCQGRAVRLSLAELLPRLHYGLLRELVPLLDADARARLCAVHDAVATERPGERLGERPGERLGESASQDLLLGHLYQLAPHDIGEPVALWRELLRLLLRQTPVPRVLAERAGRVIGQRPVFAGVPVAALLSSRTQCLRTVQRAWEAHVRQLAGTGEGVAESTPADADPVPAGGIPFAHPDIHALVDSLFLDGSLTPVAVDARPVAAPGWVAVGLVQDPAALTERVQRGLRALLDDLPATDASHRAWGAFAQRLAETMARLRQLDGAAAAAGAGSGAAGLQGLLRRVQQAADLRLAAWVDAHYRRLPSLPATTQPAMLHQVPRFLAQRLAAERRIALLLFDGLALDQWVAIRAHLARQAPRLHCTEGQCFAWLPTLTSVSRQALFAGLTPREFAESIERTDREPALWTGFWREQGLPPTAVLYRKAIRASADLDELAAAVANPAVRVAGLVADGVDRMVHGAVLGKPGIAGLIDLWCESGFVLRLLRLLLDAGFSVYLTADHGNVEAVGIGRPNQGEWTETNGERVRVYRTEALRALSKAQFPGTFTVEIPGLPSDFLPLFAGERTAFATTGEPIVAHGGLSVEELIVPFVHIGPSR